eukprot:GHVP01042074.1.p1 GENE.GHVP01042074.1~~GHVP01042074.1.p1  ORF type:complete len:142 (+),score=18.02 GHVP01042074.1:207-632(+)
MISFSAHSDFTQISTFIDAIQTPNVVLVHGEKAEMGRLKNKLQEIKPQLAVFSPAILQTVSLTFPKSSVTHVLGSLAKKFKLEIDDSTESGSPIEHDAVLAVTPVGIFYSNFDAFFKAICLICPILLLGWKILAYGSFRNL